MRVIAGIHRSRVLQEVDSIDTRETKDRVKESVFNSISSYIQKADVLDLFCGSGSLGIEALSRGASHATFNDYGKTPFLVTKKNVETLHLEEQALIYNKDYKDCLDEIDKTYDIILLDPPYHMNVIEDIIKRIIDQKILKEDGIIVYLSSKQQLIPSFGQIVETKSKNIGITKVTYMKWS